MASMSTKKRKRNNNNENNIRWNPKIKPPQNVQNLVKMYEDDLRKQHGLDDIHLEYTSTNSPPINNSSMYDTYTYVFSSRKYAELTYPLLRVYVNPTYMPPIMNNEPNNRTPKRARVKALIGAPIKKPRISLHGDRSTDLFKKLMSTLTSLKKAMEMPNENNTPTPERLRFTISNSNNSRNNRKNRNGNIVFQNLRY